MPKRGPRIPSQRQLRVGEELRHALSQVLARGELRDPVLANRSITVTEVRVSPDLRNATVFFIPLGGGGNAELLEGLARSAPFLRRRVNEKVYLKHSPKLSFELDNAFETAARIEKTLRRSEVESDLERQDISGSGKVLSASGTDGV